MTLCDEAARPSAPEVLDGPCRDVTIPLPRPFALESGDALHDGCVRLARFGRLDGPQIVVLGGISAGRRVCGDGGWWDRLVGPLRGVDLTRFGVIGVDFAPLDDDRVRITPHDQARLLLHALTQLKIARLHSFIGASYGAMVGLAFAALAPARLERLCVISSAHRPSAQGLAWRGVQRRIVEHAAALGDAEAGLSLARQLAMITYRSAEEFEARFDIGLGEDGRSALDDYLISRGEAYVGAMAPLRWLSLSESIDRFAVEPEAIVTPTTVIACPSDQLAPLALMQELAQRLPRLEAFHLIPSIYGHDAFLKEAAQLEPILRSHLESTTHDELR
jgi:homoserine O-acetyltransferase